MPRYEYEDDGKEGNSKEEDEGVKGDEAKREEKGISYDGEEGEEAFEGHDRKGAPIIEKAIRYCWDTEFLDIFRAYFTKHASVFEAVAMKEQEEHDLEFTELFEEYLQLFESTLEKFIEREGSDVQEFYSQVKWAQDHSTDPRELEFVGCLLASAEYDSFYKVMIKEAKRQKLVRDYDAKRSHQSHK